jgi:hypothetical protein
MKIKTKLNENGKGKGKGEYFDVCGTVGKWEGCG